MSASLPPAPCQGCSPEPACAHRGCSTTAPSCSAHRVRLQLPPAALPDDLLLMLTVPKAADHGSHWGFSVFWPVCSPLAIFQCLRATKSFSSDFWKLFLIPPVSALLLHHSLLFIFTVSIYETAHNIFIQKVLWTDGSGNYGTFLYDLLQEEKSPVSLPIYSVSFQHFSSSLKTAALLSCYSLFRNNFWKAISWCKKNKIPLLVLIFPLTWFSVVCRLCLISSFQFKCSYAKIRKTIHQLAFLLSVLISFLINS